MYCICLNGRCGHNYFLVQKDVAFIRGRLSFKTCVCAHYCPHTKVLSEYKAFDSIVGTPSTVWNPSWGRFWLVPQSSRTATTGMLHVCRRLEWLSATSRTSYCRRCRHSIIVNNLQLKQNIACSILLYCGRGHSQSFAPCLCTCDCRCHATGNHECH